MRGRGSTAAGLASVQAGAGVVVTQSGADVTVALEAEVLIDTFSWNIIDPAAGTVVAERPLHNNRKGVDQTVAAVHLVNAVNLVGSDAANFVITVVRRTAAGVQTTIVQYTNNLASGGVTAWVPKSLGVPANNVLAPGDSVAFFTAKTGAGQALSCAITLTLTTPG